MSEFPEEKCLTLTIWETPLGYWAYGVYYGDGSKEGSLKATGGGWPTPDIALRDGAEALTRQIQIRACDHEWQPWEPSPSGTDYCPKCGIVKGVSLAAE